MKSVMRIEHRREQASLCLQEYLLSHAFLTAMLTTGSATLTHRSVCLALSLSLSLSITHTQAQTNLAAFGQTEPKKFVFNILYFDKNTLDYQICLFCCCRCFRAY